MENLCSDTLRIATWNSLADCYIHGMSGKGQSVSDALKWTSRSAIIAHVLRTAMTGPAHTEGMDVSVGVDVLCMQEVDHYDDFYKPLLADLGLAVR